jgi:hypothetical protein
MALIAKKTGEDFPIIPAGTHAARCSWVIDLGTQKTTWQGQEKHQHKVLFGFELPDELMEDGRPFFISNRYTMSLSEKAALRGVLETWRGVKFTEEEALGFDLFKVLGQPCMLTVIHNDKGGKTYANVAGVAKLPKGMTCKPAINPPVSFSLAEFDQKVFDALPEWVRNTITQSREYQDMGKPARESENPAGDLDDDIPF